MTMNTDSTPVIKNDDAVKKVAYGIYYLNLAGIFMPMLLVVGVIFAYVFENDAQLILKSHYQYLIRTFWLALLYFCISALLLFVLVGFILLPVCVIWWLIRVIRGLKALMRNEAIQNPKTWLF
ncbi:MAG: hypothetical protein P4M12_08835 [Gammaproteobacteria bacterium]|nr:hypothetical protein [Gammaproteobacteria bacterium]